MKNVAKDKVEIKLILSNIEMPSEIKIREYEEKDFPAVQKLYEREGWLTIIKRPEEAFKAWGNSHPALVAEVDSEIAGVVRALTDTEITMYISELLVSEKLRKKGLGSILINACHLLYPNTRIEVLASEESASFYKKHEFRSFSGFRKSYI